ncbi:flagellar hook-length control protein FliK [Microbacterium suwonense]|uniref:Flagellar hook-length control protein-like C-terminal domain-containing protein n=1 Tax=Microbacterium suwonense TaxID=683047 RepID=A0ABM8FU35_9MICO|nr:flagellar hook-length control protein FliK [Microbacterium suwonense]BDZ39191.1 hypothetical protein GCM10025863_18050 [Microbacterium suwonense]
MPADAAVPLPGADPTAAPPVTAAPLLVQDSDVAGVRASAAPADPPSGVSAAGRATAGQGTDAQAAAPQAPADQPVLHPLRQPTPSPVTGEMPTSPVTGETPMGGRAAVALEPADAAPAGSTTSATPATPATAATAAPTALPTPTQIPTPAPTAAPSDASRPALLPQVTAPVVALARSAEGEHSITLTVSPENLGPVTVRAHISSGGIRLELHAPSDAGRDALRTILTDLRRDLSVAAPGASLSVAPTDSSASATPSHTRSDGQPNPSADGQSQRDGQGRTGAEHQPPGAGSAHAGPAPASVDLPRTEALTASSPLRIDVYA